MTPRPQRDLVTAVGLLVEAANYLQRGIAADIERRTNLPGMWFETLVRLHRTPGHSTRMNEMATQVSFPPSSFSRLIDRMEAEHLVERLPDPTNRRATLIRATATGEERLGLALAVHEQSAHVHFASCLTDDEIDTLETITRKLRDANVADRPAIRPAHTDYGTAPDPRRPESTPSATGCSEPHTTSSPEEQELHGVDLQAVSGAERFADNTHSSPIP